jgi:uncharacterized membrane protein (DUF485 family)
MTAEIFIVLLVIFMLVVISIPALIAFALRKWLLKKGFRKTANMLLLGVILVTIQQVYSAIYPTDSFYKDEFENNSKLTLPQSSKIVAKNASYPGIHGGYTSVAILELSSQDFQLLKSNFESSKRFEIDTTWQNIGSSSEYAELTSDIEESSIEIVYSKLRQNYFKVAFLNDNKTIIFEQIES